MQSPEIRKEIERFAVLSDSGEIATRTLQDSEIVGVQPGSMIRTPYMVPHSGGFVEIGEKLVAEDNRSDDPADGTRPVHLFRLGAWIDKKAGEAWNQETYDAKGRFRASYVPEPPPRRVEISGTHTRQEIRAAFEARKEAEEGPGLDAMTSIAIPPEASLQERRAIQRGIAGVCHVHADGSAKIVTTKKRGSLGLLQETGSGDPPDPRRCPFAVPVKEMHVVPKKLIDVRWLESPDESDVSGAHRAFSGRRLDAEAAARHNLKAAGKALARQDARTQLQDALEETQEMIPADALSIPPSPGSGLDQWNRMWILADGRVMSSRNSPMSDRDSILSCTPRGFSRTKLALALGMSPKDLHSLGKDTP